MVAVRRFYCFAVPSALLFLTLIFLLVSPSGLSPRVYHAFRGGDANNAKSKDAASDVYDWTTHSEYGILKNIDANTASFDELCAHFPTHLLNDIQPVLRTGHGLVDTRFAAQLKSVSACFGSHLLVLSDKAEVYQNHTLIDVIAELPSSWRAEQPEQFLTYDALYNSTIQAPKDGAWKIDKFKFLPAMSTTWRMRPDKRWYIFYEGDTYVFWDAIFRYLQYFDPDKPWYFGSPSPGREDPKTKTRTRFENGGPGFILSREALRRITRDDWDPKTGEYLGPMLARKYWDNIVQDCCGDSVLGWTLHQQKVPTTGLWPMMTPHPPEGIPFSDIHWCQPIISMHKPALEKMEGLWRWQWATRQADRPLLWRDMALSYHKIHTFTLKNNWRNDDWGTINTPEDDPSHASTDACNKACKERDDCFQWTYHHPGQCALVNSFRVGRQNQPERDNKGVMRQFTSCWMKDKINAWANARTCEKVQWMKPSSTRIF